MKHFILFGLLAATAPLLHIDPVNAQTSVSFRCDVSTKVPRTVAKTAKKEVTLITWQSKAFASSGFTPERRCQEVSERLQKYSNGGSLRYITTGKINNQNVICVSSNFNSKCRPNGLILTLKGDEYPPEVLKSLFDTAFKVSGGKPLVRGRVTLDLEKVLNSEVSNSLDENATIQDPVK